VKVQVQKGSTHVVIIVILVVALVAALGWIFWQNFIQSKNADTKTVTTQSQSETSQPERNTKPASVVVDKDDYSFTVVDGFKEVSEQMFTYTGSLEATNTFINEEGDYFEVLTPNDVPGGIASDYSWSYEIKGGKPIVEKDERCSAGFGCSASNGSVEGLISGKDNEGNYYFSFGNKSKNTVELSFVDDFLSTFRFKYAD